MGLTALPELNVSKHIAGLVVVILLASGSFAMPSEENGLDRGRPKPKTTTTDTQENEITYWRAHAMSLVESKTAETLNKGVAKNVILFLGDGMSVTTLTAARMYMGQQENLSGETSRLSFEDFPYSGFSRTYCVDQQVGESACTSTAYLGGVKANAGTIGVTAAVSRGNCELSSDSRNHVDTILSWAQAAGKGTGVLTTTRITHASPAGNYAHVAERDWEGDSDMHDKTESCLDIAYQLVHTNPGKKCKVVMGGGRSRFLPTSEGGEGSRKDNRSLIMDWQEDKLNQGTAQYVSSRAELLALDLNNTDYLLGLFQKDHMLYHLEDGSDKQPTLEEMTRAAIQILSREENGFYLFVEGGRIDMAHHSNWARRSLDETVEFQKAVKAAVELTSENDTLIVVTADHAHTLTMSGYPKRGEDILGAKRTSDRDHLPYTTLSYANGPSAEVNRTGYRRNLTSANLTDPTYQYPSLVPLGDETHGGDDVAVYARGPWAHLLTGNYEQTLIPHVMAYSARLGPLANRTVSSSSSSSTSLHPLTPFLIIPLSYLLVR